jgi:hypothetical protein
MKRWELAPGSTLIGFFKIYPPTVSFEVLLRKLRSLQILFMLEFK